MEENYGKKRKIKGKRLLDLELRKSIEVIEVSSCSSGEEDTPREPKKKEPFFKSKNRKSTSTSSAAYVNLNSPDTLDSPITILVDSSTASSDATVKRESPIIIKKRSSPKKWKKILLGLDIRSALIALQNDTDCNTVRQSRRIAQLKSREKTETRKLEEIAMSKPRVEKKYKSKKTEDKDYKVEKKKKNKNLIIEEDIAVDVPEVEEKKKKRKRKRKDPRKIFDGSHPWRSSSDSNTSNEENEEEEIADYSEAESSLSKSDHEFSPESDLEESGDVQPLKQARTARKEDDVEEDLDDHACQKCGKQDHPEWILLCNKCDNGWHCSCLRPALLIIPEGDWFCPPCQHLTLIKKLKKRLVDYDKQLAKRNIKVRRKKATKPVKEPNKQKRVKKTRKEKEEEDESEETESETESSTDSESDEPIYQLRQRRQVHNYRFNDYDELIDSALQDEVEAKGIGIQGRGKDIATLANVLPVKEPNKQKLVKKTRNEKKEKDESESEETESETESSSDSQDEVEAKRIGNQGRGKDIATLANVLPVKEPNKQKRVKKTRNEKEEKDESDSEETESETESSSDSQDEVEAKRIGNQGRGKGIATLANVLPVKEPNKQKLVKKTRNEKEEKDESESAETESETESSSDSESDEPIYQLRQRRKVHSSATRTN